MKTRLTYIVSGVLFLLFTGSMFAQQNTNYTFYRYNMNFVNPAYAGAHEGAELGLNLRNQWASVQGAPETESLFFATNMGRKVGLGVSIINDKTFIESQVSLSVDFSYRLRLSRRTDLYLGIKAGANSYDANTDGLTTYGITADPSLMNIEDGFTPNVGAGLYLKGEKYFINFSVPRILTPDRLEQRGGLARLGIEKIQMYLGMGYDLRINENIVFKPSTMIRHIESAPLSVDLTAVFSFVERFELGAAYKIDEGSSALFLFNVSEKLKIGYAYESALQSPIRMDSNGTHEIFIKFGL